MIDNNLVRNSLDRILAISWQNNNSCNNSQEALFIEFLRRMSHWAKALDCGNSWPFFDVAKKISSPTRLSEDVIDILSSHLSKFHLNIYLKYTCVHYVNWAMLADSPVVNQFGLPCPYEPLILMYERGETFYTEHGFIFLSQTNTSVYRKHWENFATSIPIVELDTKSLDALDSLDQDSFRKEYLASKLYEMPW